LELNESVINQNGIKHLGYRYHVQNADNTLIFKYDNTPHFPSLETFPHHKHEKDVVSPYRKPSIPEVLNEAIMQST
jgi:hypothetical protein